MATYFADTVVAAARREQSSNCPELSLTKRANFNITFFPELSQNVFSSKMISLTKCMCSLVNWLSWVFSSLQKRKNIMLELATLSSEIIQ